MRRREGSAAARQRMRRVLIVGNAGTGKTTLAKWLAAELGVTTAHLDALWFGPGWVPVGHDEFERRMDKVVAKDGWVIDGNYRHFFDGRGARADTLVWLDLPLTTSLWRAGVRWWHERGKPQGGVVDGCEPLLTWKFLSFILLYPFKYRPFWEGVMRRRPNLRVFRLRTLRDVEVFKSRILSENRRKG